MQAMMACATGNEILIEIVNKLIWRWVFWGHIIWPETLTDETILVFLSLFIAIRAKLEIFRPFI